MKTFFSLNELKYPKTCFKNALFANETNEAAKKLYFCKNKQQVTFQKYFMNSVMIY